MSPKKLEVMFEFLLFGIVVGIAEDLLAVKLATGEAITWRVIGIIVLIAIPFAILGEVFVDKIDFIKIYRRVFKNKKMSNSKIVCRGKRPLSC